jgi:hypothetical protein
MYPPSVSKFFLEEEILSLSSFPVATYLCNNTNDPVERENAGKIRNNCIIEDRGFSRR